MDLETIRWELQEGVARITLDRPDSLNAWTKTLGIELREAVQPDHRRDPEPR